MKLDPTIEEQSVAFRQHLAASEYLYREAIAALAVSQAVRYLRPDIPPSPRRSVIRAPRQLLGGVRRGIRRLVLLAVHDRRRRGEARPQRTQSDGTPIIIDYPIEPYYHPAQRLDPHMPWSVVCSTEIQTDDDSSSWSVIRTDNDNPEKGADDE